MKIKTLPLSLITAFFVGMVLSKSIEANEQTDPRKQKADQYLEFLGINSGVFKTKSGLLFEMLKVGGGRIPKATDTVEVYYVGKFTDGTIFDDSRKNDKPAVFRVNQVIDGWTEGLQLMKEGSIYRFTIPYFLAYGEKGRESVPPYANLIFEIELVAVHRQ